jgi:hypothetical protein
MVRLTHSVRIWNFSELRSVFGFLCGGKLSRRSRSVCSALATRFLFGFARALCPELLGAPAIFVNANRDVANDAIVHAHATLELSDLAARSFDLQQHEIAFRLVQDFVSQWATAQTLSFGNCATLIDGDLLQRIC